MTREMRLDAAVERFREASKAKSVATQMLQHKENAKKLAADLLATRFDYLSTQYMIKNY